MPSDHTDLTLQHSNGDRRQHTSIESPDWEYEYDEDETEDFYLTLDLTTHVHEPLTNQPKVSNNGKQSKGILDMRLREYKRMSPHSSPTPANRSSTAGTPAATEQADGVIEAGLESTGHDAQPNGNQHQVQPTDIGLEEGIVSTGQDTQPDDNEQQEQQPHPAATMQLIGLHTTMPYLLFNNKFYTTYWLTDLGTQIWVSRPGVTESPVWTGHVLDIVGSSQVRLLAKPAKLQQRYDDTAPATIREVPVHDRSATQLSTPHGGMADTTLRSQVSFMERLSALKIKKGELDQVPMHSVKAYEYPSNAAEIRAQSWAALETAQAGASSNAKAQTTSNRASKPAQSNECNQRSASVHSPALVSGSAGSFPGTRDDEENEADDDLEHDNEQGTSSHALTTQKFLTDGRMKETRGRTKRSTKLAGLGLTRHDGDESPKPKRRRRNKAQIAEDRAAAEAAWAAKLSQQ